MQWGLFKQRREHSANILVLARKIFVEGEKEKKKVLSNLKPGFIYSWYKKYDAFVLAYS